MTLRLLIIMAFAATSAFAQVPAIEPGVSHDLARWRAAHYSDVRYKLNLTLEKMSPVLKGTIEIRVRVEGKKRGGGEKETATRVSEPGAIATGFLPPIILDWRKIRGSESLSTISNVSVNGAAVKNPVAIAPGSDSEHLIFRDGVREGENVIKLDFTSPILTSGSAITRYVDREDGAEYIYSLFVPSDASTAFPVFDQPDLKARFSLTMTVPAETGDKRWRVVSNAFAKELFGNIKDNNDRVFSDKKYDGYVFAETKPISTYVFAFAAGPWKPFAFEDVVEFGITDRNPNVIPSNTEKPRELEPWVYVRRSQVKKYEPHSQEIRRLTRGGIKYLETYFDYKFPFPKYDLVLIPEFPFGGMEHAGATFLRESSVIFPTEPTKNDQISRANLIFHETAHQWFGDTVTMKWFDDLWLKEGFAEFMAYKALEKVMPEANAWKVFYERNKQAAYLTDSTRGTTPIYQEIANLSAAKSAYGNIVYRKAPSFLRQAEFYLGPDKFQTAVRAFLKKHEFANAGWEDLVKEFEGATGLGLKEWGQTWLTQRGVPVVHMDSGLLQPEWRFISGAKRRFHDPLGKLKESSSPDGNKRWLQSVLVFLRFEKGGTQEGATILGSDQTLPRGVTFCSDCRPGDTTDWLGEPLFAFPNYRDYGYGIFLLDDKSRDYVLKNIQNEKDDFLRTMMWGSLWDSVRETELAPKDYVELVIRNLSGQDAQARASARAISDRSPRETDEGTIATLLNRVSTAMNYYLSDAQHSELAPKVEAILIDKIQTAPTLGQRITFYRAFLNIASTERARNVLKQILKNGSKGGNPSGSEGVPRVGSGSIKNTLPTGRVSAFDTTLPLKTKDKFDIVTRLIIRGDPEGPALLAALGKTETSDDARRYAYAAQAGFATNENKAKFWNDFINNKQISESWIEAAMGPFNSVKHSELTLLYLEKALAELPNLKRNRKIFFVNGWLGAFIGGQSGAAALAIVNKFLADNPSLDRDLRLKILENVDLIERAVKIRKKFSHE